MYNVFFHQTSIYLHLVRENCHSQHTSSSIILRCMKNDEDGWSTYNLREKSKPFVEKYCTYKPTKESSQNIRKPRKINYIAIRFLVRIGKYNKMKIGNNVISDKFTGMCLNLNVQRLSQKKELKFIFYYLNAYVSALYICK